MPAHLDKAAGPSGARSVSRGEARVRTPPHVLCPRATRCFLFLLFDPYPNPSLQSFRGNCKTVPGRRQALDPVPQNLGIDPEPNSTTAAP